MSLQGKQIFIRKTGNSSVYKWAPQTSITDKPVTSPKVKEFCNAVPYSVNTEDTITKYVTNQIVIDGEAKFQAYVACDYVK